MSLECDVHHFSLNLFKRKVIQIIRFYITEKAHLATIAELKQELKEQCQGFKQELTLVKQRITDLENISRQKDERIETLANRVSFLEEDVFQKSFLIDKQVQYLTDEPLGAFGVNANESEVVNKSSVNQGTRKKEENGSRQNNNGNVLSDLKERKIKI